MRKTLALTAIYVLLFQICRAEIVPRQIIVKRGPVAAGGGAANSFAYQAYDYALESASSRTSFNTANLPAVTAGWNALACARWSVSGSPAMQAPTSSGDTWTLIPATLATDASAAAYECAYATGLSSAANKTVTFNFSPGATFAAGVVIYFSSTSTPTLDAAVIGTSSTGTSFTSPSFSTTNGSGTDAGIIIACGTANNASLTWTAGNIGGSASDLRFPHPPAISIGDMGCETLTVASAQSSITAAISISSSFAGRLGAVSFK